MTIPAPDVEIETTTTAPLPEVTAAPKVQAEALSEHSARISWEPVEEQGVPASRYRVICDSEDHRNKTPITIETLEPQLNYTCSVYGVWDDLVPGVEVISAKPGISNHFIPSDSGKHPSNIADHSIIKHLREV